MGNNQVRGGATKPNKLVRTEIASKSRKEIPSSTAHSLVDVLPRSVLVRIFEKLTISELFDCALVCKSFVRLVDGVFKSRANVIVSNDLFGFQMFFERSQFRRTSSWRSLYCAYRCLNEAVARVDNELVALYDYKSVDFTCKRGDTLWLVAKESNSAFWLVTDELKTKTGLVASGYLDFKQPRRSKMTDHYVRALFPYVATTAKELSFEEDEIMSVLATHESGWWKVQTVKAGEQRSGYVPSSLFTTDVLFMKALVDYIAATPHELSLQRGQVVIVLHRNDSRGFLFAQVNGHRGWVPDNLLVEVL